MPALVKCECAYTHVCVFMYIILYLARGIPRKVMNPVEHEATPSMIDMRSYFMGASHAYR